MKATLRGTEIYFDLAGMQLAPLKKEFVKKPVLFLLHGGPGGNHFRYKQHSLGLQDAAQLVFIDHRGCGLSKKTKRSDYTLENNIEDIEALRKHLGLDRFAILGTSYGGIVAQGYAIRYPKHLDKLILVVTPPSYRFIKEAKEIIRQRGNAKQIAASEKLFAGQFKTSKEIIKFFEMTNSLYSIKAAKKRQALIKSKASIWSPNAINEGFAGFLRSFDYTKQLKKIKCPTLILAGKDDWICPPSQAKILAAGIPHAQLKIFKDCGHALAIDQQKKYIKAIKDFLLK